MWRVCIACTMDQECGHGLCNKSRCVCMEWWTNSSCDYRRKSQQSAFLYGFFMSAFGAGRYYMSLILSAVFQMIIGLCCIADIVFCWCGHECDAFDICDCEDECEIGTHILTVVMALTTFAWFVPTIYYVFAALYAVVSSSVSPFLLPTGGSPISSSARRTQWWMEREFCHSQTCRMELSLLRIVAIQSSQCI